MCSTVNSCSILRSEALHFLLVPILYSRCWKELGRRARARLPNSHCFPGGVGTTDRGLESLARERSDALKPGLRLLSATFPDNGNVALLLQASFFTPDRIREVAGLLSLTLPNHNFASCYNTFTYIDALFADWNVDCLAFANSLFRGGFCRIGCECTAFNNNF